MYLYWKTTILNLIPQGIHSSLVLTGYFIIDLMAPDEDPAPAAFRGHVHMTSALRGEGVG